MVGWFDRIAGLAFVARGIASREVSAAIGDGRQRPDHRKVVAAIESSATRSEGHGPAPRLQNPDRVRDGGPPKARFAASGCALPNNGLQGGCAITWIVFPRETISTGQSKPR
jgi:hypothetical protein